MEIKDLKTLETAKPAAYQDLRLSFAQFVLQSLMILESMNVRALIIDERHEDTWKSELSVFIDVSRYEDRQNGNVISEAFKGWSGIFEDGFWQVAREEEDSGIFTLDRDSFRGFLASYFNFSNEEISSAISTVENEELKKSQVNTSTSVAGLKKVL